MIPILLWWLIIQLLGWAALPIAYRLLHWLPDRGYTSSKAIGLLLTTYLLWLGATLGLLPNTIGGALLALLLLTLCSTYLLLRPDPSSPLPTFLRQHKTLILASEALFTLAFIAWAILRAYASEKIMPAGGEKFMEIAFLNAILRSPRFPPLDPWLSGYSISYYYFGYVMMALITRLSAVPSAVAFDLYDALLFALSALGAFGLVYNLIPSRHPEAVVCTAAVGCTAPNSPLPTAHSPLPTPPADAHQIRYGLLAAFFLVVISNLEGVLESLRSLGKISDGLAAWTGVKQLIETPIAASPLPTNYWWWWHASRVIWDNDLHGQPIGIENITEFPFFSFLLGDNHPHVLNLPFVLLALALALNLLHARLAGLGDHTPLASRNPLHTAFGGDCFQFLSYALCLGALGFLNTWDFPIYLVVVALAFALADYTRLRRLSLPDSPPLSSFLLHPFLRAAALFASLLAAGAALYIFFYISFSSQAGGILPYIYSPTRLLNYFIMFGPFLLILIPFLIVSLAQNLRLLGAPAARRLLIAWLIVLAACASLYALLLLIIRILASLPQLAALGQNTLIQQALGDLTLDQALLVILQNRLAEPWLLLLLTALITLAAANAIWRIHLSPPSHISLPTANSLLPASLTPDQLFVPLLIFAGLGLSLSVEFFYLRDSFGLRMNTIFKFYYQTWVMLSCASAYAVWHLLNSERTPSPLPTARSLPPTPHFPLPQYTFFAFVVLLIAAGLVYPVMAVVSRTNGFRGQPDLDAASALARQNPEDWAAIAWLDQEGLKSPYASLQTSATAVPVILEAPYNGSYNYRGRISAFSGFPTVLGWAYHELQWRGSFDEQSRRMADIETIYATHRPQEALDLLRKWQVNYVIVGPTEQAYVQDLCRSGGHSCTPNTALSKFGALLKPVFTQGALTIYQVP